MRTVGAPVGPREEEAITRYSRSVIRGQGGPQLNEGFDCKEWFFSYVIVFFALDHVSIKLVCCILSAYF